MQLDQEKIEAAIIAEVAEKFISDDELRERVRAAVKTKVDKYFAEQGEAEIQRLIDTSIKSGLDKVYTKVDNYGRPEGQPTTIGKELEKLISSYWSARVDKSGKATTSDYNTMSRAEWIMTMVCADDFRDNMKQHIINSAGGLKDGLRAELSKTVNQLLNDVFRVRSAEDQAKALF